jgi:hypothetical protein
MPKLKAVCEKVIVETMPTTSPRNAKKFLFHGEGVLSRAGENLEGMCKQIILGICQN